MPQEVWLITGFESTEAVYKHRIPLESLSEPEVLLLLQRLASRHLTPDEVASSSLRENTPGYTPLLQPTADRGGRYILRVEKITGTRPQLSKGNQVGGEKPNGSRLPPRPRMA